MTSIQCKFSGKLIQLNRGPTVFGNSKKKKIVKSGKCRKPGKKRQFHDYFQIRKIGILALSNGKMSNVKKLQVKFNLY